MTKIHDLYALDLIYPMSGQNKYSQLNPLIMAAYPHSKLGTEEIMIHARTRAYLQLAIQLAEQLGLLYFGYSDPESRDVFSLQFNNQERLIEYIKELKIYCKMFGEVDRLGHNNNLVQLHKFERTWFICTFWQDLLPHSLIRKTLKQGLVLADLKETLNQKKKRMGILLGGELDSLDLIINAITSNAY